MSDSILTGGPAVAKADGDPFTTASDLRPADYSEGREAVVGLVQQVLTDRLLIDVASPDDDLIENGHLDSFALVELLVNIEEQFGVELDLEHVNVDDFRSARSIATLVLTRRDEQSREGHPLS